MSAGCAGRWYETRKEKSTKVEIIFGVRMGNSFILKLQKLNMIPGWVVLCKGLPKIFMERF
jgi:hypothetical protein